MNTKKVKLVVTYLAIGALVLPFTACKKRGEVKEQKLSLPSRTASTETKSTNTGEKLDSNSSLPYLTETQFQEPVNSPYGANEATADKLNALAGTQWKLSHIITKENGATVKVNASAIKDYIPEPARTHMLYSLKFSTDTKDVEIRNAEKTLGTVAFDVKKTADNIIKNTWVDTTTGKLTFILQEDGTLLVKISDSDYLVFNKV